MNDAKFFLEVFLGREPRAMETVASLQEVVDGRYRISPEDAAEDFFLRKTEDQILLCFLRLLQERNKKVLFLMDDPVYMDAEEALVHIMQVAKKECGFHKYFLQQVLAKVA